MITIKVRGDRQTLSAATAYELVGKLNRTSFDTKQDQREWMKAAAERAQAITGLEVRADTAAHFINDLISSGLAISLHETGDDDA